MSAQIDLTERVPEGHPMHGVWTVPCTFDGKRVDISLREEQPDARFAMYEQVGIQVDRTLLPCVNEMPVPAPVITPAVYSDPVTEMQSTWDWPRDEDGQPLLDENGERLPKVETGVMVEVTVTPAEVVTPAVVDTRTHVDVILWGPRLTALYESDDLAMAWAVGMPAWQVWALQFRVEGTAEGLPNKGEDWTTIDHVSAIYPDSINSRSHVIG